MLVTSLLTYTTNQKMALIILQGVLGFEIDFGPLHQSWLRVNDRSSYSNLTPYANDSYI
jgi:hypothetical protein